MNILTIQHAKNKGFSLLGVLASAFIAIIVIVAISALITQVYSTSRLSKNRFIASYLAKEGVELVGSLRDGNWFHYPEAGTASTVEIKWRGEATDNCPAGTAGCLRSICDGDGYIVDVKDGQEMRLKKTNGGDDTQLYLDENGIYTHQKDNNTKTVFSRSIEILTNDPIDNSWVKSNCGDIVNADPNNPAPQKPMPFIVRSVVKWEEKGFGEKQVELTETFYDWLKQRP